MFIVDSLRSILNAEAVQPASGRFRIGRIGLQTQGLQTLGLRKRLLLVVVFLFSHSAFAQQLPSSVADSGADIRNLGSPPAWFQESQTAIDAGVINNSGATGGYLVSPSLPSYSPNQRVELGGLPPVNENLGTRLGTAAYGLSLPPSTSWGETLATSASTAMHGQAAALEHVGADLLAPSLSGEFRLDSGAECAPLGFSSPPTIVHPSWEATSDAVQVYDGKFPVPVQEPWIQWGERFYGTGMTREGGLLFSPTNLTHSKLYVYGDFRLGVGGGRNAVDNFANVASRLNLDIDWAWTSTERFHAFLGPLNRANQFSQVDFTNGDVELDAIFNPNLVTGFFEGDLGYMFGGLTNTPAEFDLPIAAGLMPLFHQNGIWMDDAVTGIALARNSRHSRPLNWSNYDATVFVVFDQLNSPAFGADANAAQALGTAWFIEAYGGYIETGYAYLHDREELGRSYHNATLAYTRRYFDRIGNSIRVIINSGQDLPEADRTADGGVLILENNWITATPLTLVPYWNAFYGWGRPQSVARNALAGGVLRNIGINFETDGLNGYPTLDDTAINTYGGAVGVNLLGANLDRQLVLEAAMVQGYGLQSARVTQGDQFGFGTRYQHNLSHRTLLRLDAMIGIRRGESDLHGIRCEWRYKF